MVYKFFNKNSTSLPDKSVPGRGVNTHENDKIKQNQHPLDLSAHQLAEKLHRPIIKNFNKRTFYSGFRDNIWGVDLADMQLISKFNKGFRFLLCVIDIFSKFSWVVPLKDKKGVSIVQGFQKMLNKSGLNPIWVDKGSEFYNSFLKIG